jgi:hypothetical protein
MGVDCILTASYLNKNLKNATILLHNFSATFGNILANFGHQFFLSPYFFSATFELSGRNFYLLAATVFSEEDGVKISATYFRISRIQNLRMN